MGSSPAKRASHQVLKHTAPRRAGTLAIAAQSASSTIQDAAATQGD